MAPEVSFTRATLPYPIFAADFDPYNRGYLIVGGGGGESKTGVRNQISVLDISKRACIETAAEIDLSRDEDSVQSLANLASKDGLITFAGINSSQADRDAGKNEHFRSFNIKYPPRKKQKTGVEAGEEEKPEVRLIGKSSLFKPTGKKSETYQRLLRLSPAQRKEGGGKRIGAIATGFGGEKSEIVVFNATVSTPGKEDVIARIEMPQGAEADDLDLTQTEEGLYSLTYCTSYDVYEQTIEFDFETKKAKLTPPGPRRVMQMPAAENKKARHKFRALRFLNSANVVTLVNKAGKSGVELRIFHLYPTGPANHLQHLDMILPKRIKQATSMDVCALDTDRTGIRQIALAVGAQDLSIEVYITNYARSTDSFSAFKKVITLRDVHEHQMTKVLFAPFHSPARKDYPATWTTGENGQAVPPKEPEVIKHPGPQYLRLASVSYGNTVVLDTFALSPLTPADRDSRYVLLHPSSVRNEKIVFGGLISFIVVVFAILAQSLLYPADSDLNAMERIFPPQFLDKIGPIAQKFAPRDARVSAASAASAVSDSIPTAVPGGSRLKGFLQSHYTMHPNGAVIISEDGEADDGGVNFIVHESKEEAVKDHREARHWHELSDEQKERWRRRLVQAGEWMESEGESVLKGILFSSYAGFVGQAMG